MATITNVQLQFRLAGSETVTAGNQQVYLDLTPGAMTHLRSNARGRIVSAGGGGPVSLDDSRDYRVVTSATPLSPPPSLSQGTTVRVSGSHTITVAPHIRIQVTSDGAAAVGGLRCVLAVGAQTSNATSTSGGWIWSNDHRDGAVTLRADEKLIKPSGAANPTANLAVNPAPPTRGSQATISIDPPSGAVGFKVTEWKYEISHTNPGSPTASTATVTRPANESSSTFDQSWEGTLCASGTVKAKFVVGATLRTSGAAAVSATVLAVDPVESTLAVTVDPRTGTAWESEMRPEGEHPFTRPINRFRDVGEHIWTPNRPTGRPLTLSSGPNKGCEYVPSFGSLIFTSGPGINTQVTNPGSAFAQAQDKAYLEFPTPVRVIPHDYYTVGPEGVITITNTNLEEFSQWANIATDQDYGTSNHCIDLPRLQTGTRRHESGDPARSHRANCIMAMRALDPIRYIEELVKLPGHQLHFGTLYAARVTLVVSVEDQTNHDLPHKVLDEAQTRSRNELVFSSTDRIPDVNDDANGTLIGPVWNPIMNRQLTN